MEIIIRRDVKFNENVLAYDPDLAVVPSYYSFLGSTPSSYDSLDTDSDDEIPPPPVPPPAPNLPRWVHSTREVVGDLASDAPDQHRTCSQFQRASSLLAQVS